MTTLSDAQASALMNSARQAAGNAYAPYSHFPVGAALLVAQEAGEDQIITGANVENVSYGLTICAERAAVVSAVTQGHRAFKAIAVWAEARPSGAVTPCGACRQFLVEFMDPNAVVVMGDDTPAGFRMVPISVLLPEAFGRDESCPGTDSNKRID